MEIGNAITTNYNDLRTSGMMGAQAAQEQVAGAAEAIQRGEIGVEPMADLQVGTTLYTANLQVMRVADEMAGQVLNLRA